jgi:DNA mismatch endonuclease (patch repair protein)
MVDRLTPTRRSALMARVRSRDTGPELFVRRVAHRLGYRFRLHQRDLPGTPDLVFPRLRSVIFVHGCFWHRHRNCKKSSTPGTRVAFWMEKFSRNIKRDAAARRALWRNGWRVLTIWECQLKRPVSIESKIAKFLASSSVQGRIKK